MIKLKNLIILVSFFFSLINFGYSEINLKIIMKINNQIITNYDLEKEAKYLLALNPRLKEISKKQSGKNKESKNKNSSNNYHALSKLDLKVLLREVNESFNSFLNKHSLNKKGKIFLTGRNSQHKNLVEILGENLKMDVS